MLADSESKVLRRWEAVVARRRGRGRGQQRGEERARARSGALRCGSEALGAAPFAPLRRSATPSRASCRAQRGPA